VRMPFEMLMRNVANLSDRDAELLLGELAERWGEPA